MNTFSRLLRELSDDGSREFRDACRRLGMPPDSALDPYQVLRVSADTSPQDLKKAWRRQVQKYHPDRDGGDSPVNTRVMQLLGAAHTVLTEHREQHDAVAARRDARHPRADANLAAENTHGPATAAPPSTRADGELWARYGRPHNEPTRGAARTATTGGHATWGSHGHGHHADGAHGYYQPDRGVPGYPHATAGRAYPGTHGAGFWWHPPADPRVYGAPVHRPPYRTWAGAGRVGRSRLADRVAARYRRVRAIGDGLFVLSAPFWLYGLFVFLYLALEIYYRGNAVHLDASALHYRRVDHAAVFLLVVVAVVFAGGKAAVLMARDRSRGAYLACDLAITALVLLIAAWGVAATLLKLADHELWFGFGFPSRRWPLFFP